MLVLSLPVDTSTSMASAALYPFTDKDLFLSSSKYKVPGKYFIAGVFQHTVSGIKTSRWSTKPNTLCVGLRQETNTEALLQPVPWKNAWYTEMNSYIKVKRYGLLPHIIGITAILITADNKIIWVHNTGSNATSKHMIAGSASGSVDWTDTAGCGSLSELLNKGMLRELEEETLVSSAEISHDATVVTGRWFHPFAGSKPEFTLFYKTFLSSETILNRKHSPDEQVYTRGLSSTDVNDLSAMVPPVLNGAVLSLSATQALRAALPFLGF